MNHDSAFINLRDTLAHLYPDGVSARRIARDSGINVNHIAFHGEAINDWDSILREAESITRIEHLISVVLKEYKLNPKLQKACNDYRDSQRNAGNINIPFVIVTMTDTEARELVAETVFDNWPMVDDRLVPKQGDEQVRFQKVKERLPKDFFSTFGAERNEWKPYGDNIPIREFIEQISDFGGYKPQFFSEQIFAQEKFVRNQTIDYLQLVGCVLIVDAISLFHPRLRYLLESSGLVAVRELTAILILSPPEHISYSLNQTIENDFLSSQTISTIMRRIDQLDLLCEFSISGQRSLRRWLHAILPQTAAIIQNQMANNRKLELFRSIRSNWAIEKTSIHKFFT